MCSEVADGVTWLVGFGVRLFREPDAGNLPIRFDQREQETERKRGETGKAKSHANLTGSESCGGPREEPAEALTGESKGI